MAEPDRAAVGVHEVVVIDPGIHEGHVLWAHRAVGVDVLFTVSEGDLCYRNRVRFGVDVCV